MLEGVVTIASEGGERTYLAGEIYEMPAGRRHAKRPEPTARAILRDGGINAEVRPRGEIAV